MAQELEVLSHLVMQGLQKVCLQGTWTGESMGSVRQMLHASVVFWTGARPVSKNESRVGRRAMVGVLRLLRLVERRCDGSFGSLLGNLVC